MPAFHRIDGVLSDWNWNAAIPVLALMLVVPCYAWCADREHSAGSHQATGAAARAPERQSAQAREADKLSYPALMVPMDSKEGIYVEQPNIIVSAG